MNKIQFEELLKPLLSIYDEIELDLIRNILNRIANYDDTTGSLEWYLNKLADLGAFDKENLKLLKKNKKKIKEVLSDILKQAATNKNDFDRLNNFYQQGLLNIDPSTIYDNVAINNLISEATKDTNSIMDLINTKAIEGTKEEYKNILNKAYLETSTGIYTYTESIRKALKEMANNGIQIVHYESGRKMSIESAVRRDIITITNKLVGEVELQHAKDLDTNLVYVDQHLGARVRTKYMKHNYEAHAEWQGKKYMIEGSSDEYPNLYEVTGLGEMLGLKGINCYHDMRPTFEWENIPEVIDEIENAIQYEKLQRQREYERKIKFLKREKEIAKHQGYNELLSKNKIKLSEVNKEYNTWLEENGLTRDYNREYTNKVFQRENLSEIYNNQTNRNQYERYKEVLSEDVVGTFDKFLEIKYNNSGEWTSLKLDYSDAKGIYNEAQANMYINLVKDKFREGQQGKHIVESPNYIDGNSYVTISNEHIQELVNKYATKGEKKFSITSNKWTKTEKIITNEIIGVYINKKYNSMVLTNSFTIRYSKRGYHIVPADFTERSD